MPYSAFGALTDHFRILAIANGAGTLADDLELISSTKTLIAKSRADAQDENGDIAASTWFGAPATMFEASSTFAVKSGSFSIHLLKLGFVESGMCILSFDIKTENGGWPQLTVSGRLGCIDPATLKTYTLPAGSSPGTGDTITGIKTAQAIGFTVTAGCKLTSSGVTASIDFAEQTDGLGVPAAQDCSGGTISGSASFVGVTAAPAWTVTGITGATETQAPGSEEPQAAYNTGSGAWEMRLAVD